MIQCLAAHIVALVISNWNTEHVSFCKWQTIQSVSQSVSLLSMLCTIFSFNVEEALVLSFYFLNLVSFLSSSKSKTNLTSQY